MASLSQIQSMLQCSPSPNFPSRPLSSAFQKQVQCKFRDAFFKDHINLTSIPSSSPTMPNHAARAHSVHGDSEIKDPLRQAVVQLVEEDLQVAAKKYNLEEELFAEIDFAQINAFADRPFTGNSAAVCYLPFEKDDQWLQLIAQEFNLSATAFLVKRHLPRKVITVKEKEALSELRQQGSEAYKNNDLSDQSFENMEDNVNEYDLRWFTPTAEINLCGHATLASAHLLFSSDIVESDTIIFHTKSGPLKARKISGYESDEGRQPEQDDFVMKKGRPVGHGIVELDFPVVPASRCIESEAQQLSEILGGIDILWVGSTGLGDYLVELPCSRDVQNLKPQFNKMKELNGRGGIMVTARSEENSPFDFISRFFCPKTGILEDSVTGSAHCSLGPFWAGKLGKNTLEAFQASKRGGKVTVRVEPSEGRVYLQGGAILVMAGVLLNTMRY